jgi:hypothetical protein
MSAFGDAIFSSSFDRPIRDHYYVEVLSRTVLDADPSDSNILIQFSDIPEAFQYIKSAIYNRENIIGRSEPLRIYSHSEPTIVQFTGRIISSGETKTDPSAMAVAGAGLGLVGRFYAPAAPFLGIAGNVMSLINDEFKDQEDLIIGIVKHVHYKVAHLEALCYPQYDVQGIAYPPPKVRLVFGRNFMREGIITSCSPKFYGPYEMNSMLAYNCDVSLTFEEANPTPLSYTDVRNGVYDRLIGVSGESKEGIWSKLKKDGMSMARSKIGI